jgi:putative FmdB family regulatory protein
VPVYSYACQDCGHSFDQRQSITDAALTVCPECEGRLHKVISAVGVVFKGSGFYRTDSRTGGRPGRRGAAGDAGGLDGGAKVDGGAKADGGTKADGEGTGAEPGAKSGEGTKPAAGSKAAPGSGGAGPSGSASGSASRPPAHTAA